jgi:hypothetical protein
MRYKLVKFLSMDKAVLENQNKYYVASFSDVPRTGPEVLVFPADLFGDIMDYGEVDGGPGYKSLAEFIVEKCTAL